MQRIGRAEFLRGDWAGRNRSTPLPWSISAREFFETCTGCDACIKACSLGIIERGSNGYPRMNFSRHSCTFCGDCARACEQGAFHSNVTERQPALLLAFIHKECLAHKDIFCRACSEACAADAIAFHPAVHKVPQPEVDPFACTGCGECYRYCPVNAIRICRTESVSGGRLS